MRVTFYLVWVPSPLLLARCDGGSCVVGENSCLGPYINSCGALRRGLLRPRRGADLLVRASPAWRLGRSGYYGYAPLRPGGGPRY